MWNIKRKQSFKHREPSGGYQSGGGGGDKQSMQRGLRDTSF